MTLGQTSPISGTPALVIGLFVVIVWIAFPFAVWSKMDRQIKLMKQQLDELGEIKSALRGKSPTRPSLAYKPGGEQ